MEGNGEKKAFVVVYDCQYTSATIKDGLNNHKEKKASNL